MKADHFKHRLNWKYPLVLVVSLLVAPPTAQTAQADESAAPVQSSNWTCSFCTYASGWFGSFDVGTGYVSESDLKFAQYRGTDKQGVFASLYGDMHYRNHGLYFDFYARDLGTSSRQLELRGGREGKYELRASYSEIPIYRGFGASTPYTNPGSSHLTLPPAWVQASTTSGMSSLTHSLGAIGLQTLRKTFKAGLSLKISGNWRYQADFRHANKNGTRPFGAGVFTIQSSIFPAPVDFNTDQIDMSLEYSGKRSHLRFGFRGTWFDNANQSISWENPFSPIGNTQILRAALEPDSDSRQFSLSGVYVLSPKIRISGSAAAGQVKQNSTFLPYSSNPDFDDLPLPRESLDQRIDSSSFNFASRLTARLSRNLKFTARIKGDERDNRTPVVAFTPVITDLVQRAVTFNRPYSFERHQYFAELGYRPPGSVNFLAGVKKLDFERSLQSVRKTEDRTLWAELSFNLSSISQLRLRLENSDRDTSSYTQVSDTGFQENILMRKFNLAGRSRERVVMELNLTPTDRLSTSISYWVSEDDYDQSQLGLLKSEERSYSLDLAYALMNKLSLHAFLTQDNFDSSISGAQTDGASPWLARTDDRFTTFGIGLSGKLNENLDLSMDFVSAESTGRINTNSGASEAPFPELETSLKNLRLQLNYRVNHQWSLLLAGEHEKYRSEDWQIDGLGNDGIAAILTLGNTSPDYSISLIRVMASYRF